MSPVTEMPDAVVLLSGGLDSSTALAIARSEGFDCYAVSFYYGQRHDAELRAAKAIASRFAVVEHRVMGVDTAGIGGSALTDSNIDIPVATENGIPATYVPARNTVFLALALGWAEVIGAKDLFVGVNAIDYSGYPDCRPEFIRAFERLANLATKAGTEGTRYRVHTPLITLTKSEIIQKGMSLSVDYSETVSCYQADEQGRACGVCDACRFRKRGFAEAGIADPTRYVASSA